MENNSEIARRLTEPVSWLVRNPTVNAVLQEFCSRHTRFSRP